MAGRHAHVRPLFALPPTIPERLPIAKGEVTYIAPLEIGDCGLGQAASFQQPRQLLALEGGAARHLAAPPARIRRLVSSLLTNSIRRQLLVT